MVMGRGLSADGIISVRLSIRPRWNHWWLSQHLTFCWMPFLTQPSQSTWAWSQHRVVLICSRVTANQQKSVTGFMNTIIWGKINQLIRMKLATTAKPHLTTWFQNNVHKLVPECQIIVDCVAATGDEVPVVINVTVKMYKAQVKSAPSAYKQFFTDQKPFLPGCHPANS